MIDLVKGNLKVHNDDTLLGPRAYFNPIALEVKDKECHNSIVKVLSCSG